MTWHRRKEPISRTYVYICLIFEQICRMQYYVRWKEHCATDLLLCCYVFRRRHLHNVDQCNKYGQLAPSYGHVNVTCRLGSVSTRSKTTVKRSETSPRFTERCEARSKQAPPICSFRSHRLAERLWMMPRSVQSCDTPNGSVVYANVLVVLTVGTNRKCEQKKRDTI